VLDSAATMKNTTPVWLALLLVGAPALAEDGAALYDKKCSSCHGKDGKGGSGPPIAGKAETAVAATVKNHPPPMKFKLSQADVDALAKYVAGLKP